MSLSNSVNKLLFGLLVGLILSLLPYLGFGQDNTKKFDKEDSTPLYHFYPSGDPTGLFYYDGYYYNNWGSAYSKDLVHWKYTEYGKKEQRYREARNDTSISKEKLDSLRPTRLGGSGTIVIDRENTSGLGKNGKIPFVSFWHNVTDPWFKQKVGLGHTVEPGKSWTRYKEFPILNIDSREFRDPHVFWHEDTEKWIMAIGEAEIPKIKFYSSTNLKDWEYMSDWGPWGATDGVWECVDMFPLQVDGDPDKTKWVLVISVQPLTGQYFIGDFNGEKFTIDPKFSQSLDYEDYIPKGEVLFDFENGHDNWEVEGDAFSESPASKALYYQSAIMGYEGKYFVNSYHDQASSTGKITSPPFKVSKNYINFLVGGGYYPGDESVNLIVDGEIVREQSGNHSGGLQWVGWDVSEFRGKEAHIEIVDNMTDKAGYIYVDHIMLGDELAKTQREEAFWIDYGPDFYAVRSWNNYPDGEDRQIWTGWMGSWRYAGDEPVPRLQSVPRSVQLKSFPEGIRLIQEPIKELESLRKSHKSAGEHVFEGLWQPESIQPSQNAYELQVNFENIDSKEFGLKLAVGDNEQTVVGYRVEDEELYLDRRDSGYDEFSGLFPKVSTGPLKNRAERVTFQIFVDRNSIEVFANDGEGVISSKIYPKNSSVGIEVFSAKGEVKVESIDLWELESIDLHGE